MGLGEIVIHPVALAGLNLFLEAVVFAIDIQVPRGIATGLLHVYPVLVAAASRNRRLTVGFGVLASLLILLGWWASPPSEHGAQEPANRFMTIVVVWTIVLFSAQRLRAADALREAERESLSLFNFAGVMLVAMDREGVVTRANPKTSEVLGVPLSRIIGRKWIDAFVPQRDREKMWAYFADLVKSEAEDIGDHENTILSASGEERFISWCNTRLRDRAGDVIGTLSSGADVTAILRSTEALAKSEATLRAVVETAVDAIIMIDLKGKITAANPAANRMFGYEEGELIGQNVAVLTNEPDRSRHDGYIERYLSTGEAQIIGIGREVTGRRKDGTPIPVDLAVSQVVKGSKPGFVGILRDVTAKKQADAALREHAALVELGHMAAVVAHEVKNPLAGIRGAMQVLGRQFKGDAEAQDIIAEVLARIDELTTSINERLMFARSREPRIRPISLRDVVRDVCDLVRKDPRFRRVTLETSLEADQVDADSELLRGVLVNLFLNAAQAMEGAGTIRISVRLAGDGCEIEVRDTGPGIPPHVRERVFERFFTTKSGGAGLGLSIVRQAVESHGGSIRVDCPDTGGTTFTIRLPLLHPKASAP